MNIKREVYLDPQYRDPTFGSSCFRRHLRILCGADGVVRGVLEDDCHGFEVNLRHDGQQVTDIEARWQRYPTTTCPGSAGVINSMVGCPLSNDLMAVKRYTAAGQQCTHLHDLAALLVIHAFEAEPNQESLVEYQVEVSDPDPESGEQRLQLRVNGSEIFDWRLKEFRLVAPSEFSGLPIMKGFMNWAVKRFSQEDCLRAFILQMGYFVSTSRLLNFPIMVGMQAQDAGHPANACYASMPERMAESFKVDHKRNFEDCPEQLLRFADF